MQSVKRQKPRVKIQKREGSSIFLLKTPRAEFRFLEKQQAEEEGPFGGLPPLCPMFLLRRVGPTEGDGEPQWLLTAAAKR